ncbi:MAG: hypothetical protein Q9183_002688, partial [Haloplaca sp. 2 TL-2023]
MATSILDQVMTATGPPWLWSQNEQSPDPVQEWRLDQKVEENPKPTDIQLPPSPVSRPESPREVSSAPTLTEATSPGEETAAEPAKVARKETGYPSPVSDHSVIEDVDSVEGAERPPPDVQVGGAPQRHVDEESEDYMSWNEKKEKVITRPFEYLMAKPGKSFRRQLLTTLNFWTQVDETSLGIISRVVEMLHNASLLIDDIQDQSKLRRGGPSAHLVFGTAQTINAANYVYFLALRELAGLKDPWTAMLTFNEELLNLHRGQGLDLFWRDTLTVPTEEEYLEMISLKTGGLFRLAARLLQSASSRSCNLVPLVEVTGLIFQVRDDYQNLCNEHMMSTKGYCDDLTEGKFSFPVVHSIRNSPDGNNELLNILKQHTEDNRLKAQAVWYMQSETDSFEYTKAKLRSLQAEARRLDDLCVRFIINLPQEELESVERICFQVEEAQWYYEDFIRPLDPDLPSLNLRNFCLRIFQHCPLLSEFSPHHHAAAFEEFLAYKTRVPVRGAIMLNEDMDEVVLVKGWKKGANWSFPRGKINKDESDLDCAMREVYEETGFDVEAAGLAKEPDAVKYIDVAIQHQHLRLYVFRGVPMDTSFEARTRKEISRIDWWKLSDLPTLRKKKQQEEGRGESLATNANKFYMVAPFLVPLKKWISQQKKAERSNGTNEMQQPLDHHNRGSVVKDDVPPSTKAVAASGDMERLLAGLRQPAVNHSIEHEQGTSSSVKTSANEASMQLKNLLCVPTKETSRPIARDDQTRQTSSKANTVDGKKSASLLALLKGGPPSQQSQAPQTPMEQVIEPPAMPESPKHYHKAIPHTTHHQPPPSFPGKLENTHPIDKATMNGTVSSFDQAKTAGLQQKPISAWSNFQTTIAQQDAERNKAAAARQAARLDEEEKSGGQRELKLPTMNETWRQVKVQEAGDMGQASQRRVVKVMKRPVGGNARGDAVQDSQGSPQDKASNAAVQSAPAPYQATSIPPISSSSRYPDIYRPVIPAANKLPMPKLTAHSSSLLNLFKDGKTLKAANHEADVTKDAVARPSARQAVEHSKSSKQGEHTSQEPNSSEALKSVSKSPEISISNADGLNKAKRPQSAHQATLLGLFGKPSTPAGEPTPPPKSTSLDVPANLVELSAMPSPGHSREPSKVDTKVRQTNSKATVPDAGRAQKRSRVDAKQGNLPVSATVNGPLNVPQFDMIAHKVKESHQNPAAAKEAVKKSPVTILARPVDGKAQGMGKSPTTSKSKGENATAAPEPTSKSSKNEAGEAPPAKPFQPQILRRPPPEADKPKNSPVQPQVNTPNSTMPKTSPTRTSQPSVVPTGSRGSPSPVSVTERPSSKTKVDHKATLLSLFTKSPSPKPSSAPGQHDLSAF